MLTLHTNRTQFCEIGNIQFILYTRNEMRQIWHNPQVTPHSELSTYSYNLYHNWCNLLLKSVAHFVFV